MLKQNTFIDRANGELAKSGVSTERWHLLVREEVGGNSDMSISSAHHLEVLATINNIEVGQTVYWGVSLDE